MNLLLNEEQFLKHKSRDSIPLKCGECSNIFYAVKNEIMKSLKYPEKYGNRDFCSNSCRMSNHKETYTCSSCNIEYKISKNEMKKRKKRNKCGMFFCSLKCANKTHLGNRHSSEALKKQRETNKINRKVKTLNCPICNILFEGYNKTCSEVCASFLAGINISKYWNNIENRKQQSNRIKKQYSVGTKIQSGGTTSWIRYKNIKVQGTYEYRTCEILDRWKDSKIISSWKYSPIKIPYLDENMEPRTYLIDFKVTTVEGLEIYIEVKGRLKIRDISKWNYTSTLGYKLQVWFLEDIKKFEKGEELDESQYLCFAVEKLADR